MNKNILYASLLSAITLISGSTVSAAAESDTRDTNDGRTQAGKIVVQSRSTASFKDLLYSVWGRIQAFGPGDEVMRQPGTSVATLGMRGARLADRNKQSDKGDVSTNDLPESAELTSYMTALRHAEAGDLDKAADELSRFIEDYGESELRPNALFALGISQASLGENESARWTMVEFVDQYPQHLLSQDANALIEEFDVLELLDDW